MKIQKYTLFTFFLLILTSLSAQLWAVDILAGLQLTGQLQVFQESDTSLSSPIKNMPLTVQLVLKDPQRSNSPRGIQFGAIQFTDLAAGSYIFKVNILHQGSIKIASIEAKNAIQAGSSIDFSGASWRYDYDDDSDGFANITEFVNGHLEDPTEGGIPSVWIREATSLTDSTSFPSTVSLLKPTAISAMAPSSTGQLKILGDPFAVQSGVEVIAILRDPSGASKGKFTNFSRLDGSFDVTLSNALIGDKVEISTASMPSRESDTNFTSLGSATGSSSKKEMIVQEWQVCQ